MKKRPSFRKNKLSSLIWHGKGCKYVLSDMKRPVFYVETSNITQKQTVHTQLALERLQICTFWHEKASALCRNIKHKRRDRSMPDYMYVAAFSHIFLKVFKIFIDLGT